MWSGQRCLPIDCALHGSCREAALTGAHPPCKDLPRSTLLEGTSGAKMSFWVVVPSNLGKPSWPDLPLKGLWQSVHAGGAAFTCPALPIYFFQIAALQRDKVSFPLLFLDAALFPFPFPTLSSYGLISLSSVWWGKNYVQTRARSTADKAHS